MLYIFIFIWLVLKKKKLCEVKKRMQHHHCQAAKLEDPYDHTPRPPPLQHLPVSTHDEPQSMAQQQGSLFTAHNTHLKKLVQELSRALLSYLNANPSANKAKRWICQQIRKFWLPTSCVFSMLFLSWVPVQHSNSPPELLPLTPTFHRFLPFFRQVAKLMATSGALE